MKAEIFYLHRYSEYAPTYQLFWQPTPKRREKVLALKKEKLDQQIIEIMMEIKALATVPTARKYLAKKRKQMEADQLDGLQNDFIDVFG